MMPRKMPRVAKEVLDKAETLVAAHNLHFITKMQHKVGGGHQFNARAEDARHVHIERLAQLQVLKAFAVQSLVGNQYFTRF